MTNGVIVALGDVGRNVAAGMSGGILYLYSEAGHRRDEKRHHRLAWTKMVSYLLLSPQKKGA